MAVHNHGIVQDDYYVARGQDGKPLPSYWMHISNQVIPDGRQDPARQQPYDFQAQHQQLMDSVQPDSSDDRLSVHKTNEAASRLHPDSDMDKVD